MTKHQLIGFWRYTIVNSNQGWKPSGMGGLRFFKAEFQTAFGIG